MRHMLGEIKLLPYDDIPLGWLVCKGQSVDINDYPKLYMLIGTKFGSDDKYQFNLPDLTSEAPENMVYCISTEGELPYI